MDGNLDLTNLVSAGSVALLFLEGAKWIIRLVSKKPIAFPPAIYAIGIPILNVLVVPLLALVGFEGYTVPTDWRGWVLSAIRVAIGSLISWGGYAASLKPLKAYNTSYKESKALEAGAPIDNDGYPGIGQG